ncbi:ras-related protein R-Ras2-like [Saccostrea cucullata]|uniref:ras-related protein R-Ras2-like n=1 Tax=Saccostrea cuccullata TaxID=36930 RepID=UPI002ED66B10
MTVHGVNVVVMNYRGAGSNGVRGRGQSINDNSVCKIVVLGCPGVGKTALTVRYLTKRFIGEYSPTLESIYKLQTTVDDDDVRLEILDTAGQDQEYWKDGYALWADCFVFVYSIRTETFRRNNQIKTTRTKTGSGKIIIYQSMGVLNKEMVTVVIAPIQSIMEEQVDRLNKIGMSAIYIDSLKMPLNEIIGGKYQFIYGSPEIIVDSTKWREIVTQYFPKSWPISSG